MKVKRPLVIAAILLVAGVLAYSPKVSPPPEGDPVKERGERAAEIGRELVGVVRAQLDALPAAHRDEVEEVISELEREVTAVTEFLRDPAADAEAMAEAVSVLERTLEGVIIEGSEGIENGETDEDYDESK